jgi:hypothetical protein
MTRAFTHGWALGGALMLGSVVVGTVTSQSFDNLGGAGVFAGRLLLVASIIVFAVGLRRSESVTARRPLGTVALLLLALWLLVGNAVLFSAEVTPDQGVILGYIDSFVLFTLALIGVMQIARATALPRPWNLAPSIVLGVNTVTSLLIQLLAVFLSTWPTSGPGVIGVLLIIIDTIAQLGGLMALGVIAIVLADRVRQRELATR